MVTSKAQMSKLDITLRDANPDITMVSHYYGCPGAGVCRGGTRGYCEVGEELETVEMIAAKRILGCSKATRTAMLGSGLGMHQVITNGDKTNRKRQCSEGGTGEGYISSHDC